MKPVCFVLCSLAILIGDMQCSISFQSDEQFFKTKVQIEYIENQMRDIEEELNIWEERIVASITDISEDTVEDEIVALEMEVERTIGERNASVTSVLTNTRNHLDEITARFDDYQQELNTTRSTIEQNQVNIDTLTDRPTVAFNARTPKTTTTNGETVPFYRTTTNIGHAYNNQTGIFTAPVDGLYLFTVQISTMLFQYFHAQIVVNSNTIVGHVRQADVDCKWVSTAGEGLATLVAGDTVSVRRKDGSSPPIRALYDDEAHWSSFSGVLLHAT